MYLPKQLTTAVGGLAIGLAVAACSGAVTAPATTGAQPQVAQVQAAVQATATAAPSTSAIPSGATRLALTTGASRASYTVGEQLAGRDLPNDAVGTTSGVTGSITLNADGTVAPGSQVAIDLSTLASDESRRDNFVKSNVLQTATYPTAEFVPTKVEGLAAPLPTSGTVAFKLIGNLTVHGVTKEVTWDVTAQAQPTSVSGTAQTTVTFAQFGLTAPKVGPVLSVNDQLQLQLNFQADRTSASA
jgi:polyisoprenoid-binding protein YceI